MFGPLNSKIKKYYESNKLHFPDVDKTLVYQTVVLITGCSSSIVL